jgi:hypothetical protein
VTRCTFGWHKWGKWETWEMLVSSILRGQRKALVDFRECGRCGKKQFKPLHT